jgi:predicted NUDIX family NTP pyrophosphohydrolase
MKRSAGTVLYRHREGRLQVLIVHMGGPFWARKDARAWSFPKGEYEAGEDPRSVAAREFAEELGSPLPDAPVIELGSVAQGGGKTVIGFAREGDFDETSLRSNTFEMQWPPRSGRRQHFPEVDRAAWVEADVAREKLVAAQVDLLDRLEAVLADEPPSGSSAEREGNLG